MATTKTSKAKAKPKTATASKKAATPTAKKATNKAASTKKTPKATTEATPTAVPGKMTPFLERQRTRLLVLKDTLLDSMSGVARDSLRSRAEGSEASAFGMHQADAGSDAYDRDFALSLLSQEQDSLYEIDEALKRVENGTYGVCEISGKPIPKARLEALPFTRYTVECQAELEKRKHHMYHRQTVNALFGGNDEEDFDEDHSDFNGKD